jgi:hypothetical protein
MFGTRTRKVLSEIWLHKTRTALVAINIFIGVLGVVTLTSVSDLMIRTTKADLHKDELPMVYMNVTLEDYSNIDNAKTLEISCSGNRQATRTSLTVLSWLLQSPSVRPRSPQHA